MKKIRKIFIVLLFLSIFLLASSVSANSTNIDDNSDLKEDCCSQASEDGDLSGNPASECYEKSLDDNQTVTSDKIIKEDNKSSVKSTDNDFDLNDSGKQLVKNHLADNTKKQGINLDSLNAWLQKINSTIERKIVDDIMHMSADLDPSHDILISVGYAEGSMAIDYPENTMIGEDLDLRVNFYPHNNFTEGYVLFKINDITLKDNKKFSGSSNPLKVPIVNNTARTTIRIDNSLKNAHTLTAIYHGTSNITSKRVSIPIRIRPRSASINVTTSKKMVKQGERITLTANIHDDISDKLLSSTEEYVFFKVNGLTLKDSHNETLKIKVIDGIATTNYTIPLGLAGITDSKTFTVKNHTITACYVNKNYNMAKNNNIFQVTRSTISIDISNVTINSKCRLSLNATIRDYLGNNVLGPNKFIIKINGISIKNGSNPIYYYSENGVLNINNIQIPHLKNYSSVELVTQDRLAYFSQRNITTKININNESNNVKVIINNKTYNLQVENTPTGSEFLKLLPQTFRMKELNANEKYVYINTSLTANPLSPGKINKGDVMLYQSDCIVLFYKTFDTSYSYTPIGHIENLDNLDSSDMNITFDRY